MKYIKILLLVILFLMIPLSESEAHVLKSDGTVGAVIHVTPEDDPIAGETTDFYFEFKDKVDKFIPEDCDCRGLILQNGIEIYSAPLFQNSTNPSLESASFSYAFPEKNVYEVRVSGKPLTPGAFESFTLTWNIRVARESNTNQPNSISTTQDLTTNVSQVTYIPLLTGVILFILFIIYFMFNRKKMKRKEVK